ncbi:hypothetical protein IFM89_027387 [Coptis chinensis]|uniref:Uncharacterized protein n=1 Tax=Coptis chinensis TaxID=261450 RepID=A0A835H7J3_9MAGN|nr:hypothetical protein IFM89_027387 [Coptis chinensis]
MKKKSHNQVKSIFGEVNNKGGRKASKIPTHNPKKNNSKKANTSVTEIGENHISSTSETGKPEAKIAKKAFPVGLAGAGLLFEHSPFSLPWYHEIFSFHMIVMTIIAKSLKLAAEAKLLCKEIADLLFCFFTTGFIGGEVKRSEYMMNSDPSLREAIQREVEKERIREEIIAQEIIQRRELEAEVRRELAMERDLYLRRPEGYSFSSPSIWSDTRVMPSMLDHQSSGFGFAERLSYSGRTDVGLFAERLPYTVARTEVGSFERVPFQRSVEAAKIAESSTGQAGKLMVFANYIYVDGDGTVPVESAKADGLNAVARVGVHGDHRGIICNRHVFQILQHWLRAGDPDPFYDPVNDYVILPTNFEMVKHQEGGTQIISLKEDWEVISEDQDDLGDLTEKKPSLNSISVSHMCKDRSSQEKACATIVLHPRMRESNMLNLEQ